jgi:hypothetical protein
MPFCGIAVQAIEHVGLLRPNEIVGVEHGMRVRTKKQDFVFQSKEEAVVAVWESTGILMD